MSLLWSSRFEVGSEDIDRQHKELFGYINKLIESCERHDKADTVRPTLDFLLQYSRQHFHDEEALQEQYEYPGLEAHKKLHGALARDIKELADKFERDGSSEELVQAVNEEIITWFFRHIVQEDIKIGEYLRHLEQPET